MNMLTVNRTCDLGTNPLLLITAFLLLISPHCLRAEYIPNENFNPVWTGIGDEPPEGPDFGDPDGDQLATWLEIYFGTNAWNFDTDGDGISDDWEIANGLDPKHLEDNADDPDGDFILNFEEYVWARSTHMG